ncbi:MAG: tRNA (adenosine(37)-N6)-threonylcarbamoyltransferase complex ATPase subunit type 1 TsaE [Myxococcota bacterium]
MHCRSRNPAETRAVARSLGAAVGAEGLLIALSGPLGAGKTVFVQGLAEGLGIDPRQVTSPTFVIAAHHQGPRHSLVHADLYRVEHEAELEAAGWLDWLAPPGVVAVEWADRLPQALPAGRLEIRLSRPGAEGVREIRFSATGDTAIRVLARALGEGQIPTSEEAAG